MDDAAKQRFLAQLEQMRHRYLGKLAGQAEELEQAMEGFRAGESRAEERVKRIVHRLSGTAGTYGLDEIARRATEIDVGLEQGAAPGALASKLASLISLLTRAS